MDRTGPGANNVYADQGGNVHRQTSQGWESRGNGSWNTQQRSNTAPSNLGTDSRARQSGASQMNRSYGGGYGGGRSMGGGGMRGGGGRR
jgi:hypothetical protein